MSHVDLLVKKLRANARIPSRATPEATGLDIYACLDAPLMLRRAPIMVPAGIVEVTCIHYGPGANIDQYKVAVPR